MKVKILQTAKYSKFTPNLKVAAQELEAGTVINFPDWYALSLVDSGLAKAVAEGDAGILGAKVIFEQDLDDPTPLVEQVKRTTRRRKKK